jgi:hypothetical protein
MDLTTKYLGLKLRSPLVVSASPLSEDIDNIKRMEDAGAAAVVLYSLFEEQLRQDRLELNNHLHQGTESFAEALISQSRKNFVSGLRNTSSISPPPKRRRASRLLPASMVRLKAAGPNTPKKCSKPARTPSN